LWEGIILADPWLSSMIHVPNTLKNEILEGFVLAEQAEHFEHRVYPLAMENHHVPH
jgi:hypothetical protein